MNEYYRAIFISDIHLGTKGTQANQLFNFLKHNECDQLYLVGDIIDVQKLKRKIYQPQEHSNAIRYVLTMAKSGTYKAHVSNLKPISFLMSPVNILVVVLWSTHWKFPQYMLTKHLTDSSRRYFMKLIFQ